MTSWAETPVTRGKPNPRTYLCALCGKPVKAEDAVYSTWTHDRFHFACVALRKFKS